MIPAEPRPATSVPAGVVLASIRRRVLGAVLDQLLVLIPVAIGVVAWGYLPGDQLSDTALTVLEVATISVAFVYYTIMIALLGRTVGKFATGTRVVRLTDAAAVGWFAAAQRSLLPLVATTVPVIGFALGAVVYAAALMSPLRQGLHDRAAGTLVVLSR